MKYAANLSSETCTIASGTSGTNGTGTGLKVDVTTNSSGVITTLVPNTGNAGVNFARGDSLTLPDTADDGTTVTASSSPVAAVITVNEIDYVLGGAKDTSSGFTAYTGSDGHVRESNSATFSLAATIDSPTQTATVPGSEVTTSIFVFSSYVGIFITYRTWQIAYGDGKTYSTFSAAVEGYNIVVGAVVTQDLSTDYVDTIVGVADGGDHVGFNTLSIATAESGTALSIAITPTTKTTYDVSAPVNTLEDNSTTVNLTMSTSTIKTTGTATLELQGKETSPGSIGLSNISNLIVDSDMVFTTDQAHGFGTGTKVSFTNVQFKGSSGGTATGDVIAGKGPNNEGANDFIKYVVTKVSERTFTIGTEADPSTALHGIRFYESTAFDATGGAYILVSGVVKPERASIVNNASLVEQQIS